MKIGIRYIASIGPRARDLNNKAIVCLVLFSALSYAYANQKLPLLNFGFSGPTTIEDQLLSSINSTNIYQLARELEQITLNVNLSGLTCRSAGSRGADIAAERARSRRSFQQVCLLDKPLTMSEKSKTQICRC